MPLPPYFSEKQQAKTCSADTHPTHLQTCHMLHYLICCMLHTCKHDRTHNKQSKRHTSHKQTKQQMVCRTLSHKDPKHCSAMAKRFLLSDSTAYGWLPSRAVSGNGVEVVQETIAFISCGGSLIRKGTSGPSILTLLSNWIKENPDFLHQDAAVCCKAVPARDSVPQRSYDALERGRDQWQVPETKTPIMHIAPEAYKGRTLHFKAAVASTVMQTVVQVALQDFPAERFPVLVCAGWNVSEKEHIDEMLALRHLCDAQDWKSFKVAVFQHSSEKVDFAVYCHCLRQPPPLLFQTNTEDHDQAAENKSRFAPHLTREFVPDNGCATDIFSLGGKTSLTDTTHSNVEHTRPTFGATCAWDVVAAITWISRWHC